MFDFDLIVIGSGPAGVQAAVQAAKLHKRVCLIERNPERLGGAWIHTGTIPSKTVRESLDAILQIRHHSGQKWVDRVISDLSSSKLFGRAKNVALQEEDLVRTYLQRNGIEIVHGYATVEEAHSVRVMGKADQAQVLTTQFMLIATGSRPRRPADVAFDGWRIVDSDEILMLDSVPKRMVVYGAGVIGCEYASIFGALGVDTTIVDARSRIMQTMDQEVALALQHSIEELGVKFRLGVDIKKTKLDGPEVTLDLSDGTTLHTDVLFYAAGRVSNTERIGLQKLGIKINDRGAIVVNEFFQTNIPNIYAAGDAIGMPALAATSMQQGRYASLHAFEAKVDAFPKVFPIGVYTIPELSSVGLNEEEATKAGHDFVVGRAQYSEIARGYIQGANHGLLKLIVCRKTQKILGIHVVGEDACNLVHIGMAFMLKDGRAQDFVSMIFNYPTLAEAYRIAAFNALNKIFTDGRIQPSGEPAVTKPVKAA